MASTLNQFARTVLNMMKRYGGPGTLVAVQDGTYNPATGKATKVETQYTVTMITFDYTEKTAGTSTSNGTMIGNGVKQVYLKPDSLVPVPRAKVDRIVIGGTAYVVDTVKEFNPNGTGALFIEIYAKR